MSLPDLSERDRNLLMKFGDVLARAGGSVVHDMSDPEQRDFVKMMHTLGGHTPDLYPGLHRMLDMAGEPAELARSRAMASPPASGWDTAFGVPEFGSSNPNNLAAATGYGTVLGGFKTCNLSILSYDSNSGTILAYGSAAGYAPLNSLATQTDQNTAKGFVPSARAMMTYSYTDQNGAQQSGTTYAQPLTATPDPVVTQPQHESGNTKPVNANAICIGLGRPTNALDGCDYTFNEPTQYNPIGRIPMVGYALFNAPIKTLVPGGNFLVDIYVVRTDTGGKSTKLVPSDLNNVYQGFSIDPKNANKLTWNLPMNPNQVPAPPPQLQNPVVFSTIPWSTDMTAYLTCNITVFLNDGTPAGQPVTVIIQSADVPDTDPIDGTTYIKPIEFVWHCLGEDTLVTLSDGSKRPIPTIVAGDRLAGNKDPERATVTATHTAPHARAVYVLATDCGKTLVASSEHVIFTRLGPRIAAELQPGMQLITETGTGTLVEVRRQEGSGRLLWNLSLGQAPHPNDPEPAVGEFFANGILVGDARAERALRYRRIRNIDFVKSQVPADFHTDVETTFRLNKPLRMR